MVTEYRPHPGCSLGEWHNGFSPPIIHRDVKYSSVILIWTWISHYPILDWPKFLVQGTRKISLTSSLSYPLYININMYKHISRYINILWWYQRELTEQCLHWRNVSSSFIPSENNILWLYWWVSKWCFLWGLLQSFDDSIK